MKRKFLYQIIICSLVGLALFGGYWFGFLAYIIAADITKITFVIAAVYLWVTGSIIVSSYKNDDSKCDYFNFMSNLLPSLGLLGTVAGLVIATSGPLDLALSDPSKITEVLSSMSNGVSTALLTTGAGILGNILLSLKIRILRRP